ncbi:MAG: type VI-A CRISPR-associated RNA-guided ribonuclease Cas13a, partial [Planctomycetota bacterium]
MARVAAENKKIYAGNKAKAAQEEPEALRSLSDEWTLDGYEASPYWSSNGQAEIKRNESLLRAWRSLLGFAGHTLRDWMDPDDRLSGDLVGSSITNQMQRVRSQPNSHDLGLSNKAELLFGTAAQSFVNGSFDERCDGWIAVRNAIQHLRHATVHFRGMDGFVEAMRSLEDVDLPDSLSGLWDTDDQGFSERMAATMTGAQAETFIPHSDLDHLHRELVRSKPKILPMPRFRRVLDRVGKASWNAGDSAVSLPTPHNRKDMEARPALLAQYVLLKLVYERVFGAWINDKETVDTDRLRAWINVAVDRSTAAAKELNDDDKAMARAARAQHIDNGETISDFLDRLSRATASEVRVQKGYDPDPEAARRKSAYLDNLSCDVMVQAFHAMLVEKKLDFLCGLNEESPEIGRARWEAKDHGNPEDAKGWQKALYVILHFVPPSDVALFRSQLAKWLTLRSKNDDTKGTDGTPKDDQSPEAGELTDKARIEKVFDLYLSMHSSKFDGSTSLALNDGVVRAFDSPDTAVRLFPKVSGGTQAATGEIEDIRLPLRGLREMVRFGGMQMLESVFAQSTINHDDVTKLLDLEKDQDGGSEIVKAQKLRESLHAKWIEDPKQFGKDDQR